MSEKLQYIEEIASTTLKHLCREDSWISYLKTASNHYKYSFRDSCLIYAQRPDATAVASYELWNNVMHRYVNRGAKGIALIDINNNKSRLHYVFDVSDTNGQRMPYIWRFKDEFIERVTSDIADSFNIDGKPQNFERTIDVITDTLLDDSMPDLLSELRYSAEGSFLEELDDLNLKLWYEETIKESVAATVLFRCGYEPDESAFDFSQLYNFNTPETIVQLGKATSEISENILREIEFSVKTIEREQRIERSQEHGDQLQGTEQHNDTRPANKGSDRPATGQIRTDEERLSTEEPRGKVRHDGTDGDAVPPLQADGAGSERAESTSDITDEEEHSAEAMAYDVSGDRESSDSGDDTHEINEQDDIDGVLLSGSGFEGGKQPIIDYYFKDPTNKERADFLKNEYGTGGGSFTFNGDRHGYHGHDTKGIEIHNRGFDNPSIHLTWSKAAKRIGELIDNGRYFEQRHPKEKPLTKPKIEPVEQVNTEEIGADIAPFSLPENTNQKRRTQPQMNYSRLTEIAPHIMDKRYRYAKLKADGFMDLSIEWISDNRIAIAHYGEQNGDSMADPDMTMYIDDEAKTVMPATYQNDYVGVYQEVYTDDGRWRPKLSRELTSFLKTWLKNIGFQGHVLKEAQYFSEDIEQSAPIFDDNGKEYGFDISHDILSMAKAEELKTDTVEQLDDHIQQELTDYGYEWDGMVKLDDEVALEYFDKGYDIYLLYPDNSEGLAESEKRLIQHINDGGFVGVEKESLSKVQGDMSIESRDAIETEPVEQENTTAQLLVDEGRYKPLFIQILKQGNVSKTGKQQITELVNETVSMELFITDLKGIYGDFWSQVSYGDDTIKWHIADDGLDVFPNGFDNPKLHYTWSDIADGIITLVNGNEYLETAELPTSRLHKGMTVTLEDRTYTVDKLDILNNQIELADITFANGTGFPIFRKEYLKKFENELEQDGFFDRLEKEESKPVQQDKINFHITDDNLGVGGAKEKFKRNVEAIRLLKTIESERRLATSDEQEILSQFVGWGGLASAFDEDNSSWSSEYTELKSLFNEDEYKQARASTLNAHYTSPVVIKAMYKALENMGFNGGNIIEPAMGVGNFFGLLPVSMGESKLYGVELDNITGRIAQQLYQRANVDVMGFENTAYQDNFFDVAVGNVPFGAYKVSDTRYDKNNFLIHDYFFCKTIDKVRPGGIIAFITSKGTLDKANPTVRKYIAQRAELIGAIRLPNNAFKANAGTQVTSDIIFLKKRESLIDIEPDWVHLGQTDNGVSVNRYFADNPHMMLGKMTQGIGMYGNENETACEPFEGAVLSKQLDEAISNFHAEIEENEYMVDEPDFEDTSIPADPNVKNFSYCIKDGELYYRENSRMNLVDVNATAKERIKGMIGMRSILNDLIESQMNGEAEFAIRRLQQRLNDSYDAFVKKHGRINTRANNMAMSEDSSYYLLCSLEMLDDENEFERKADIFTKQTIRPYREIRHVDTASEALAVSLARKGKVDLGYICSLTNQEVEKAIDDLKGIIFKDPMAEQDNIYDGWQTADEYLSGDVRAKLKTAEIVAKNNPDFAHHVDVLKQVQPKDLEASDIDVKLGTVWIPTRYIEEFIFETLDTPRYLQYDISVHYSEYTGSWNISRKSLDNNVNATQKYGTHRMSAYWIIEETLNQKSIRITDRNELPDGTVTYVLNKKETMLATQKQTLLQEAFKDWIFKDETRRNTLVRMYNEQFNNIRPREYDGSHIEFIGMNPEIELREHQKNAVARQLYGGNTLLAHVVGAGKSFAMIAAAMESKRLGLSNKNLVTVPNHLTEQLAAETLRLYPSAKVLVATKKDFQTKNRKKFCSRIATGDYDVVILGHTQFEKIPLSNERLIRMLQQQIEEITFAIQEQKGRTGQGYNVKQMEKTKKSLEARLSKLNSQERKDNVIEFEELGIDRLFVDESQYYKNLFLITKMRNVAGVPQTQAQKSSDMFMKCQYIDELTGGRGVTFASGTPISNSMTEMYTVQRYLQMHELRNRGLHHFDCWASVFGETQTAYELSPEGNRFRMKTRFSKFFNLPELMSMFKNVADVQTNDMLNLPMPKLKTGKVINVSVQPTEIQRTMILELGERADAVRNGDVEPTEDNMLTITNDGRRIALDQRLANPLLPDDEDSKTNMVMRNVFDIWKRTANENLTQLVFCDLSTPKVNGEFNIYHDLKKKWIEFGVPENEIAFIHDAKNEKQKASLFAKVRSGEVRILMGSTQMMGAGTNVQSRLIAIHHCDCPWRPSDLAQRNGRILRQGNMNKEVEIYRYVTEQTFDAYSYQLIEQKQRFIGQIMTSKAPVRSAADLDEAALSYAEVKALATGNPKIKERMELDVEVSRLKLLKSEYRNQKYRYETQISTTLPRRISAIKQRIEGLRTDVRTGKQYEDADFSMTLGGKSYTEKKDAGELLLSGIRTIKDQEPHEVGHYKGFDILLQRDDLFKQPYMEIQGSIRHRIEMGSDAFGNIQRIDNLIKNLPDMLRHKNEELSSTEKQLEVAKQEIQKPFGQEDELKEKLIRLDELNHELAMDKKEETPDIGDGYTAPPEKSKDNYSIER